MLTSVRRVRCDEAKPYCERCVSTGRRCDGYTVAARVEPLNSPPSLVNVPTAELRAIRFFQERTSAQISGLYDCEFWNRFVLQTATHDDGVRHALVALSSLHEMFATGDATIRDKVTNSFAMRHYNLAIRRHLKRLDTPNYTIHFEEHLAPWLIFICIEASVSPAPPEDLEALAKALSNDATDNPRPFRIGVVPSEENS